MDLKIIFKVATGLFVIPIAFLANSLWPWWVKTSMLKKIVGGIIILPIVGLAAVVCPWWDEL